MRSNGMLRCIVCVALRKPWRMASADGRKLIWTEAISEAFDRCVCQQSDCIAKFNPDIVVGSSWGGAVALECMVRGSWSGPTLLIAPSYTAIRLGLGATSPHSARSLEDIPTAARRGVLVVHGELDAAIPLENSQQMAATLGVELVVVPGGDHALDRALGTFPLELVPLIRAIPFPLLDRCVGSLPVSRAVHSPATVRTVHATLGEMALDLIRRSSATEGIQSRE